MPRRNSKATVIGQNPRSQEKNDAKVVGATSNEGFVVLTARVSGASYSNKCPKWSLS